MNWLARLSVQAIRGERETFLWLLRLLQKLNPLNLKIKSWILIIVALIHFIQKKWGKVDKISSKFILCDHVHNSHDHFVLQSIDIAREIWCWSLLGRKGLKGLCHPTFYLFQKLKPFFASIEFQNIMAKFCYLRRSCLLSSVTMDGKDKHGFHAMPARITPWWNCLLPSCL